MNIKTTKSTMLSATSTSTNSANKSNNKKQDHSLPTVSTASSSSSKSNSKKSKLNQPSSNSSLSSSSSFLNSSPLSSLSSNSISLSNCLAQSTSLLSVSTQKDNQKLDDANIDANSFLSAANGSYFNSQNGTNNYILAPNSGSNFTNSYHSNTLQNNSDINHIYYQHPHSSFLPNSQNYSQSHYNQQQHLHQQQQYYYYPTPESSPDVQFQLLNDAALNSAAINNALNSATQHILATNNANSFMLNNNSNSNNTKRPVSNTVITPSSSNSSSSSSSSSPASIVHYGYQQQSGTNQPTRQAQLSPTSTALNSNYYNYNTNSTYSNTNNLTKSNMSHGTHHLASNQQQISLNPSDFYNKAENESLLSVASSQPSNNNSKLSQNWYNMLPAIAAAAVNNSSSTPFNIYSNELPHHETTLSSSNSYNFHHKF